MPDHHGRLSGASDLIVRIRDILCRDVSPHVDGPEERLFAVWATHALAAPTIEEARDHLVDQPGDRGIDAYFVSEQNRTAHVFQVKWHRSPHGTWSGAVDWVRRIGDLVTEGAEPEPHLERAVRTLREAHEDGFLLRAHIASSGRVLRTPEARRSATRRGIELSVYDASGGLERLVEFYEMGLAGISGSEKLDAEVLARFSSPDFQHAFAVVPASALVDMYKTYRKALFALNVRGFLDGPIARVIRESARRHPRNFLVLNNGVTVFCEKLEETDSGVVLERPQVVNGQQTTRALAALDEGDIADVRVFARIVARNVESRRPVAELVDELVRAANQQNAISARDLRANDPFQVQIERSLRQLNYEYLRKKMSRAEIRKLVPIAARRIRLEEAVQIQGTLEVGPWFVKRIGIGRALADDSPYYDKLFKRMADRPARLALRYEVMRIAKKLTRKPKGMPRRPSHDAKFVVLYLLWHDIAEVAESSDIAITGWVRKMRLEDDPAREMLVQQAERCARMLDAFYRSRREGRLTDFDPKPFFNQVDEQILEEFRAFSYYNRTWRSYAHEARERLEAMA